jgi:outer membrane protein OmpA-like peptidoglycan-associated protein
MTHRARFAIAVASLAVAGALSVGTGSALAQPTQTEILDALKGKPIAPVSRGLRVPKVDSGKDAAETRVMNILRGATRSISVVERKEILEVAKDKPSIDLEIRFDYDSAVIASGSQALMQDLGRALSNPELKTSVFLLGGHTDAKGGDGYNQSLSERRAQAVKQWLVENFKLPPDRLRAIGFGKTSLKNRDNPFAEENRRVQVVNMAGAK